MIDNSSIVVHMSKPEENYLRMLGYRKTSCVLAFSSLSNPEFLLPAREKDQDGEARQLVGLFLPVAFFWFPQFELEHNPAGEDNCKSAFVLLEFP